jgi:hypothetical protein
MAYQVMGNGGIDVDMISGQPMAQIVAQEAEAKRLKAAEKYHQAHNEAADLDAVLHGGNPLLKLLFQKMQERLTILANKDEILQNYAEMARAIEFKLEVQPYLAKKEALRIFGPNLSSFLGETESAP